MNYQKKRSAENLEVEEFARRYEDLPGKELKKIFSGTTNLDERAAVELLLKEKEASREGVDFIDADLGQLEGAIDYGNERRPKGFLSRVASVLGLDSQLDSLEKKAREGYADVFVDAETGGKKEKKGEVGEKEGEGGKKGVLATVAGAIGGAFVWTTEKAGGFWSKIKETKVGGWFSEKGDWIVDKIKGLFGGGKKKVERVVEEVVDKVGGGNMTASISAVGVTKRRIDGSADWFRQTKAGDWLLDDGFKYSKKSIDGSLGRLEKAMKEHPEWMGYAKSASEEFDVPVHVIFGMIDIESRFKSGSVNSNEHSGATGLGQFIKTTWEGKYDKKLGKKVGGFWGANSRFEGKPRTDPEAMIHAVAWYARDNANALGIDLDDPAAPTWLYIAHHNGKGGYRTMRNFWDNGVKGTVPNSYRGTARDDGKESFMKKHWGVDIGGADDYESYATFVWRLAGKNQLIADHYKEALA